MWSQELYRMGTSTDWLLSSNLPPAKMAHRDERQKKCLHNEIRKWFNYGPKNSRTKVHFSQKHTWNSKEPEISKKGTLDLGFSWFTHCQKIGKIVVSETEVSEAIWNHQLYRNQTIFEKKRDFYCFLFPENKLKTLLLCKKCYQIAKKRSISKDFMFPIFKTSNCRLTSL